jgi:hypothetical protein
LYYYIRIKTYQPKIDHMKTIKRLSLSLLVLLFVVGLSAQEIAPETTSDSDLSHKIGVALGLKASSFGPGVEVTTNILPKLHLRVGGSYFTYNMDVDSEFLGVVGSNEFKTGAISLIANWQVARGFFFAGGALYNMFENKAVGTPKNGFQLGIMEVSPAQVGELSIALKPGNAISPYLGIGLGRTISRNGVVSFALELGGVYHGKPKVDIEATGMLAPTASPEQSLLIEEALTSFRFLPMINFQLSFRLF